MIDDQRSYDFLDFLFNTTGSLVHPSHALKKDYAEDDSDDNDDTVVIGIAITKHIFKKKLLEERKFHFTCTASRTEL